MMPLASKPADEVVSERRKNALLKLLADEDPEVHQTIRQRIIALGERAVEWLRPHLLDDDALLRCRVHAIVIELARQGADNRFLAFCLNQGEDLDLEEGTWLLAQTEYPLINIDGYRALLDLYSDVLGEKLDPLKEPQERIRAINEFLFQQLGFSGNGANYYDPDNSYLNRVLDRRTGNPVSLCLLYLLLCRRLRLPVAGIAMPGHFLARFQSSTHEFYIDAFNGGKLLTKADCIRHLMHSTHGFQEGSLTPVTQRKILFRICSNLHHIYSQLEGAEESARFQRYIVALAN